MSLVAPSEPQVHFADSTDKKGNGDSTSDSIPPMRIGKSTALIATVREDEPLVTRRELWSYYRASSPLEFHAFSLLTDISLLQRRQREASLRLVRFFTLILFHRVSVLSVIPRRCSKALLLPQATTRLLVLVRPVLPVPPRANVCSLGWVVPNLLRALFSLPMESALPS